MKHFSLFIAAVFLISAAPSHAAEPNKDEKKQSSSFFGSRKSKPKTGLSTIFSKKDEAPAVKQAAPAELSEEEKKIVQREARKAAERAAAAKPAPKPAPDATLAVQPRRPIWTPVTNLPSRLPGDPNRSYKTVLPKAPSRYLP